MHNINIIIANKFRFITLLITTTIALFDARADYLYSKENGAQINFNNLGKLKIGAEVDSGYIRDGALYSSFGIEAQIYKISKLVLKLEGVSEDEDWFFKLDAAPVYDSIKTTKKDILIYSKDSKGRDIDGNNHYYDWYKNLGNKIYYLGDVPLIETYIGYKNNNHQIITGRMKSITGLDDTEVFFGDDAKFAPMSYWLSKDLFSGVKYVYANNIGEIAMAVFSGGNPTKGYTNYLGGIDSPNLKSNNTPSHSAKLKLKYEDLLGKNINGHIFASYLSNRFGSTWADELGDGKRNASVYTYGAIINFIIDNEYLASVKLFGQYTQYLSGLKTKSSQNDKSRKYKDITQSGYFIGSQLGLFNDTINLGLGYEKFDRFDYNIFNNQNYKFADPNPFLNSKQTSLIFQAKYKINSFLSAAVAYHKISNPALFVSNILDTKKTNRIKIGLEIKL